VPGASLPTTHAEQRLYLKQEEKQPLLKVMWTVNRAGRGPALNTGGILGEACRLLSLACDLGWRMQEVLPNTVLPNRQIK